MNDFLIRLFMKKGENNDDATVRERYGVLSGVVGIMVNILLAGIKLVAGLVSASIAVIADALNNLSDAGSSVITFISFKLASKPADKEHPFGHERIEYVCSMVVSFLIMLVGAELLFDSVGGFFDKENSSASFGALTFVILGISVAVKLWLFFFYSNIARKIESSVVKASGVDALSDAVSTFVILVSAVVIKLTDLWFIDCIAGSIVSLMIIYAGAKILNETKNTILGEAPVEETVDGIKKIISEYPEILGIHDMLVHNYGPKKLISSFHAEVSGSEDIYYLHDVIDNVERRINCELGILCTIHMDPIVTDSEQINELREMTATAVLEISPELSIHDFRTVVGHTHTNLIFDVVIPFEFNLDEADVIKNIEGKIKAINPDYYCVITVDRG